MRYLIALLICALPSAAAVCYPITNITTLAQYNNPANWSATIDGKGGDCAASGGDALPVDGVTTTLLAGVPGAAGAQDKIVVKSGITLHIPRGVGADLGHLTYPGGTDPVTVQGESADSYGAFLIDKHASVTLRGSSTAYGSNYGVIAQYGAFTVLPGGRLHLVWVPGAAGPELSVSGRFAVGCDDQIQYPAVGCAGNAGGWAVASVGATLNITAIDALPAGLEVGDLVELDPIPQRTPWAHPYTDIDGVTAPPSPPILPTTNDTGTAAANTCGTAPTCQIPPSTPMCVVEISGKSISLGWPHGGTTAQPYCDGTETALEITDAGSGTFWLKLPAFFWSDPSKVTWSTPRTLNPNNLLGSWDATRSILGVPYAPISNAAGTGPGRKGDSSLTISANDWGAVNNADNSTVPCAYDNIASVTAAGCYLDYDSGALYSFGFGRQHTGSLAYKTISDLVYTPGRVVIPAGERAYNEILLANADLQNFHKDWSTSFIQWSRLPNTANNRLAFRHNTVRRSDALLGLYDLSPTNPIEITGNAVYSTQVTNPASIAGFLRSSANASNVDISHNYFGGHVAPIMCGAYSGTTTDITHENWTITNNLFHIAAIAASYPACKWPGLLFQSNRVTGAGWIAGSMTGWGGWFVLPSLENRAKDNPSRIRKNLFYASFRAMALGQNQVIEENLFAYFWHHGIVGNGLGRGWAELVENVKARNNVLVHYDQGSQGVACIETGFISWSLGDGIEIDNNTCLGPSWAGIGIGDLGDADAIALLPNLRMTDNILGMRGGAGISKYRGTLAAQSPAMTQAQLALAGHNSLMASATMTQGVASPNSNNIPNPEYHRNVWVTYNNGTAYNTDAGRNVTGVTLQNPSYATAQTGGTLTYTFASASNRTLSWRGGEPVQLNWGGAGTTYTVEADGVTDPGTTWDYVTVDLYQEEPGDAPFVAMGSSGAGYTPTSCPVARWAVFLSGALAGEAYAIVGCTGTAGAATGSLRLVPRPSTLPSAGDSIAIVKSESRLLDSGGVDYVDVGIDARALPTSTQSDTGIDLSLTDYCASGCGSTEVVTGLPTTWTSGTTPLPLIPVALPERGGSAEDAFNRGWYEPSQHTGWKTQSSTGGYIGAVPPKVIHQQPGGMGGWSTVF
jgi:hypothetical protein